MVVRINECESINIIAFLFFKRKASFEIIHNSNDAQISLPFAAMQQPSFFPEPSFSPAHFSFDPPCPWVA